jgi:hypothetical protein
MLLLTPCTSCVGAAPPWRAIGLAALLTVFGTILLTLGALSLDGRYHLPEKGSVKQMARPHTLAPCVQYAPLRCGDCSHVVARLSTLT